jgi:hypothetical protein
MQRIVPKMDIMLVHSVGSSLANCMKQRANKMIKHSTFTYFAQEAYRALMYYGKNNHTFLRGECFTYVDFKNKVVDVGISTNEGLMFKSLPIRKSWI